MNLSFYNFISLNLFHDINFFFVDNFLLINIFLFQIFLNTLIIFFWKNNALERFHNVYQAEQKIHDGFIPRFGGLVMITTFTLFFIFDFIPPLWEFSLSNFLWCLTPLIFVTILEDIYNNILPKARLFFIFISAIFIFIFCRFDLPLIDFPLISDIFIKHSWILIIFLIISIASMVNAFNLIDGTNGLLLFTFTSILFCLKLMSIEVADVEFSNLLNLLILICLIQLIFNYPEASIFCGDLGAYSYGFIIAMLVIIFFGKYPDFVTWQAILILFYPAWELIFSVMRRFYSNKNPIVADRKHLHHQIYLILNYWLKKNTLANAMTTLLLFPVWGFAFFWIYIHGVSLNLIQTLQGIGFNILIYSIFYIFFSKLVSKNDL